MLHPGDDSLLPGREADFAIVETHLLRDREVREHVRPIFENFVVKPTGASGGYGVVIGPLASEKEMVESRERIIADPSELIAHAGDQLSLIRHQSQRHRDLDEVAPRHIDFRPFVLSAQTPRVPAGGSLRVALREGSLIVNRRQGGGSKDTWVLEKN